MHWTRLYFSTWNVVEILLELRCSCRAMAFSLCRFRLSYTEKCLTPMWGFAILWFWYAAYCDLTFFTNPVFGQLVLLVPSKLSLKGSWAEPSQDQPKRQEVDILLRIANVANFIQTSEVLQQWLDSFSANLRKLLSKALVNVFSKELRSTFKTLARSHTQKDVMPWKRTRKILWLFFWT